MKTCRNNLHTYDETLRQCPECKKTWRRENHKRLVELAAKWRGKNGDQHRAISRSWYHKNKDRIKPRKMAYEKTRKETDLNFKLSCILRARLNRALKGNYKSGSAVRDLGCTIPELKAYLESRFQPDMTWDNHGAWHLDHIKPLSSFNLRDQDQFLQAVHYTNLQPLWAEDNLKKSDKILVEPRTEIQDVGAA